jgi:hypothetical protein
MSKGLPMPTVTPVTLSLHMFDVGTAVLLQFTGIAGVILARCIDLHCVRITLLLVS